MYKINILLLFLILLVANASGFEFSDNFEDNDISDWQPRCVPGNWSVSGGVVQGNTNSSPSLLVAEDAPFFEDGEVTVCAGAYHVVGICARLDENDSGIYAYVSPNDDVARIRLVEQGVQSTIFNSLYADFPSGVDYELTLTCAGSDVTLTIEVPSTKQTWVLNAIDPNPHAGAFGFHMGDEPAAYWDWIQVEAESTEAVDITWMITDDESMGNGDYALEPGETIYLDIELTNFSDLPLENAFAVLQSLNSELAVIQDYATYGDLSISESSYGSTSYMVLAPLVTPSDEVYDMRLTLMADGGYQEQILFQLPVGSGLQNDFENDQEDWTYGSLESNWINNWHLSFENNVTPDGQFSFKCGSSGSGNYGNLHFGHLTSPLVNLPIDATVNFWMWIEAQSMSGSGAFDGGIVQYGRCENWIDLTPVSGYSHEIVSSSTGPFEAGTQVFSGTYGWTQYQLLIPDSLAGPGQIRFVFGSDHTVRKEGWYIDDISTGSVTSVSETENIEVFTGSYLEVSENPFTNSVTFLYSLPVVEKTTLEIFDVRGRIVSSFELTGETEDSFKTLNWNGTDSAGSIIPPGIYLVRLSGIENTTIKLIKI